MRTDSEVRGAWAGGLEDVVVAGTALSDVRGSEGTLTIAGSSIEDLVGRGVSFEEVVHRLVRRAGLESPKAEWWRAELGRARVRVGADATLLPDGMDSLRATLARASAHEEGAATIAELIARVGMATVGWNALRTASEVPVADAALGHAEDLLRMLIGRTPTSGEATAFEAYLVTVVDHGLNASTFAARVVASTGSDMVSAIVGAIGTLKGPLHGGAPGPVLDMLDAIGDAASARAWLTRELDAGRRIMGMGHRIYRVRDPRAAVLETSLGALAAGASSPRLELALAVEKTAEELLAARHPERALRCNVEFFTAVLLEAVGVDRATFSPVFACGRVAGWCAHIVEQRRVGKLVRPRSVYVADA